MIMIMITARGQSESESEVEKSESPNPNCSEVSESEPVSPTRSQTSNFEGLGGLPFFELFGRMRTGSLYYGRARPGTAVSDPKYTPSVCSKGS